MICRTLFAVTTLYFGVLQAAGAFSVTSMTPAAASTDVPITQSITLQFDDTVDTGSVSAASIRIQSRHLGPLSGAFTFPTPDSCTFTPDADFLYVDVVAVDVSTNVLSGSAAGASPFSTFFFTDVGTCSLISFTTNSLSSSNKWGTSYWGHLTDVDGDGDLDIMHAMSDTGFKVIFNNGDTTFTEAPKTNGYFSNSSTRSEIGDVDGDGDIDLVEVNGNESYLYIWKNDGAGNFSISDTNNIVSMYSLDIGDLDGDGDIDIFLGRDGGDQILFNDGSGAFTDSGQSLGGATVRALDVELADFDGDGDLDAYTANFEPDKLWLNNGDGTFVDSGQSFSNQISYAAVAGDTDADGVIELFVSATTSLLLENNGSGAMTDSGQLLGFSSSTDADMVDMNGDGFLDVLVSRTSNRDFLYLNDGTGVLTNRMDILANKSTQDIVAGDIDGDGDVDVLSCHNNWEDVLLWLNEGCADLAVYKRTAGEFVYPGDNLTYTISITNRSQIAATSVDAFDVLPPSVEFISTTEDDCFYTNGILTCDIGALAPHAGTSFTVVVSTSTNLVSPLTNLAYATMFESELGTNNNYSTVITDPTPFSYISADPANGFAFAETTNDITIIFNYEVEQSSVNSNTFILRGQKTPLNKGAYNWLDATTLVFSASNAFASHEQLSLTLTEGITNPEGRPFQPCTLQFRTRAAYTCLDFSLYQRVYRVSIQNGQPTAHRMGDLDGDGDLDTFVNGSGAARVMLNDGEGNFTQGFADTSVSSGYGLAMGDLDNDGDLDVVRGGNLFGGGPAVVMLNDGTGTFTTNGIASSNSVDRLRLADIDNDGDLDLVQISNFYSDNIVFKNDGTGVFTEHQVLSPVSASDVRLADLDNDGDLDLVITLNGSGYGTTVYLNDGDGNFTSSGIPLGSVSGNWIEIGDVDGDGDLDVFQTGSSFSANRIYLNDGNANFTLGQQNIGNIGSGSAPEVRLGDFDGDGDLDVHSGRGALYLNNGSGVFTDAGLGLPFLSINSLELADLDGDGDLDVFGAVTSGDTGGIVYFNQGCVDVDVDAVVSPASPAPGDLVTYTVTLTNQSLFTAKDIVLTNIQPAGSAFIDVNPEASLGLDRTANTISELAPGQSTDIVVQVALDLFAAGSIINVSALGVAGDTNLANQTATLTNTLPSASIFRCVASAPAMHETSVAVDAGISVTLSEAVDPATLSNGTVIVRGSQRGVYSGTIGNPDGTTITFDPDSNFLPGERINVTFTDGIRSLSGAKKLRLCALEFIAEAQGCGDFQFVFLQTNVQTALHYDAEVADMDGDGNLDVVVSRLFSIGIYWGEGNGRVTNNGTSYSANSSQTVAVGDLNNDGHMDFVSGGGIGANKVYLNNGSGVFTNQYQFPDALYTTQIELGDLDGDGDLDILELNRQNTGTEPALWSTIQYNNGDGTFTEGPQQLLRAGFELFVSAIRDLDNDGDLDITINDYLGTASIYLNTGLGYFSLSDQSLPTTAFNGFADLNNDGLLDAVAFDSFAFKPRVFTNDGNAYLSGPTNNNDFIVSSPRVVEFGDFDGDGDMDGYNIGFNSITNRVWTNTAGTTFQYANQPQQVKYNQVSASAGDMDGDGDLDLVLSGISSFLILRHDNCSYGPVDTDGDGMPDSWELIYFGGNGGIATNNNDGDTFDNLSEYIADTNPTNSMSQFELVEFNLGANGEIVFGSSSERIYTVQCTTNLVMPDWQDIIEDEPGNGGLLTLEVTNGVPDAYYRVIVELP